MKGTDSRKRSIAKSITYRIICIISLSTITYLITRDLQEMTVIVVIFQSLQILLYYLHERSWNMVKWGIGGGQTRKDEQLSKN